MAGEGVSKIGRYEVVGKLTTGGMAEIFLGRLTGPRGFEKPVVIKRILGHLTSTTFSEMFLDEARIVADIRHPNVVQVFDFGEEAGQLFMAMEYLEGESLGGILRRLWATGRSMDPAAAALIAAGACAGLHAAHELKDRKGHPLGLVHRDVSPSNLFVTYDGQVKVIDFGVAKARGTEGRTEAGQVRGKSAYMSPEQALARPIDRRSDIFSLGIVLFEMATMRRLFQRENPLLVYRAICEEAIPSMTEAKSGIPKELARIGARALERSRDARYSTTQEMRYELVSFARKRTTAEPEEVIAATMRELFEDRIAQKDALRRGIEHGSLFEELPEAETDLGATIPSIALGEAALAELTGSTRRRSRVSAASAVLAVAAVGIAFVATRSAFDSDPVGALPTPPDTPAPRSAVEPIATPRVADPPARSEATRAPETQTPDAGAVRAGPKVVPSPARRAQRPSLLPVQTAASSDTPVPDPPSQPAETSRFRRFD